MFEKKNVLRRMFMPTAELEIYYRGLRRIRYENDAPVRGVVWRRRLYPLLRVLVKTERFFLGHKVKISGSGKGAAPAIYAFTHVGRYDAETAMCAVGQSSFLLCGDPGAMYKKFDGLFMWLHGAVFVDTDCRTDRHIAKETCVKILNQGGNIIIFPEGAWNISENRPVMPLFNGAAEAAIRTGAVIVPVAMEQYGKQYYANIGENISPAGFALSEKRLLTAKLRDALSTLKWEIFDRQVPVSRSEFSADAGSKFLDGIMSQTPRCYEYTVEDIERTRYHPEGVVSPEEAFAFMKTLEPKPENAFLFRRR